MTTLRSWKPCSAVLSRCGSSRITCITPILLAARPTFVLGSSPGSASFARFAAVSPDLARAVESIGAVFITAARPDSGEGLDRADVRHAVTILALSPDDHLNLHAALPARDLNPQIRIVLRQFNRTLSDKIEQNLPNC